MILNLLFGEEIDISQDGFNSAVKDILRSCSKINLPDSILENPAESLSYVKSLMQLYKNMLEERIIPPRALKSILRNINATSIQRFISFTNINRKDGFTHLREILAKKNADYGNSAIKNGGLVGNYVRMLDKVNRIDNLTTNCSTKPHVLESLQDTWLDLAGYATIGIIILDLTEAKIRQS
jgi:hypothetical protein